MENCSAITVMVGIPGSGKTEMAKYLLKNAENTVYISSDEIRKEIFGDDRDQSDNARVFNIFYDKLKRALQDGKNALLDATNTSMKARKHVFETAKSLKKPVNVTAFVMNTNPMVCLERNAKRERVVPQEAIERMLCNYQHPQYFEGFDDIVFANNFTHINTEKISGYFSQMRSFDQNNHHHAYPLLEHCVKLAQQYPVGSIEYEAGIWHDIGKLFTRKNDDEGVSHYYGHANYGAYLLASNLDMFMSQDKDKIQEIIFYVNYHMMAHYDITTEKSIKKYAEIFGKERLDKLFDFALKDKIATGTWVPDEK